MIQVYLNKQGLKKIKSRHPWIYNKEIKSIKGQPKPGEVGYIVANDEIIATGFVNTNSKITFRALDFSYIRDIEITLKNRLKKSILKRENLKNTNSKRLVHAEADGLPGLIVDQYGDNLICSFDSAGMDNLMEIIIEMLKQLTNPKAIYKKDGPVRLKEGLKIDSKEIYGKLDEMFIIEENGRFFKTYLKDSQKTGFYLDQRKNRLIVSKYKGKRTLDLFAHSGGFGIYTSANYTKFVEISSKACKLIKENCVLNNVENYEVISQNVFSFLEREKDTYDLIIIDPPPFAKNKNSIKNALKGYKFLLTQSLKILENTGYLAIFSCSNVIGLKELLDIALKSSLATASNLEIVEFLKQDIDHPALVNIPSSLYLKGLLLRKT